eukprot:CAMPEP_0114646988 /NCGR_PEP_ID=MMETSP0191-20121206/5508_1 /TAXON_ID=126664 /ORGANISM="Sorites sp." /LENGTH=342 /DNA_ID=CAMNT_0001859981 /DNA_START=19 /DNA_END=1047 /DNA_ORIENTATION=-
MATIRWVPVASTGALVLGVLAAERLRRHLQRRQLTSEIAKISREIHQLLKERRPKSIEGVTDDLYQLPPFIPKAMWSQLGDALRDCEFPAMQRIPGERFITLRLDGSGFSKLTKRLSNSGAFSTGYSDEFARLMRECCKSLMVKFSAICGYTQSDEMTLVISPASVVRGEQQCHSHGGRVVKLCTLAAAHVTALFNFRLQALFTSKGLQMEDQHLANFDCRLGSFATLEEAMSLVLWRAADCGVNGVSDAVYKSKLPCAKNTMRLGTSDKLKWLAENQLLPLQPHQAYGSYFVRVRRWHEGVNPKTGETATSLRSTIEELSNVNLLRLAAGDGLFPADDGTA